jgi:hypothetical protein
VSKQRAGALFLVASAFLLSLFTQVRGEAVWKVAVRVGSRVFWWRQAPEKVLIRPVPQTRRTP